MLPNVLSTMLSVKEGIQMTHQIRKALVILVIAGVTAGLWANDAVAATPAQKCQAGKNKLAGRYAACRHNAEAKLVTTNNTSKAMAAYTAAIGKCTMRHAAAWGKLEVKAGGACPSKGDQLVITNVVDGCVSNIETAIGGGVLSDCPADLTRCDGNLDVCTNAESSCQENLMNCQAMPQGQRLKTGQTICYNATGTVIACAGTGQDGEVQVGLARSYVDNGDGTITDRRTELMWEKLSSDGTIHDRGTLYTWATAYSTKIAMLNAMPFAGHSDWRLPNRSELESLVSLGAANPAVDVAFNTTCLASCTVLTCSCTQPFFYWSATSYQNSPSNAWYVSFYDGAVYVSLKSSFLDVRAVRAGS